MEDTRPGIPTEDKAVTTTAIMRHRLSGWARLWIVATLTAWTCGVIDLTLSPPILAVLEAPPLTRYLIWFVGPFLIAAIWIATRWVWRGFRPTPEELAAPPMAPVDIFQSGLRLVLKTGEVLFLLALAVFFLVFSFWLFSLETDADDPFWTEYLWLGLATLQIVKVGWCLNMVWETIMISDDDQASALEDEAA